MKGQKRLTRREMFKLSATVAGGSLLVACAPAVPQIVKETVVVQQTVPPVKETVLVQAPTSAPAPISAPDVAPAAQAAVYEVYSPYGVSTTKPIEPVKRLDTLDGKTICGIGNSFHFEETFVVMAALLKTKYPTATFIGPDVFNAIGTDADTILAALPAKAKEHKCDAFIVGNGC